MKFLHVKRDFHGNKINLNFEFQMQMQLRPIRHVFAFRLVRHSAASGAEAEIPLCGMKEEAGSK
jgi:hypothetical protein